MTIKYKISSLANKHVKLISTLVKKNCRNFLKYKKISITHRSIALFQLITYPDKEKVSMLTTCTLPRSVPTYNHLL